MEDVYSRELIDPAKWHVSVAMLNIKTEEGIATAKRVVQEVAQELQAKSPSPVTFQGVGQFGGGRVAYVRVADDHVEVLTAFIASVRARLTAAGVNVLHQPDEEITAHITMAKHRGEGKNVSLMSLRNFHQKVFGTETITTVHLCSHNLPKSSETGYYWSF